MRIAALLSGEPRFCREFDYFLESLSGYSTIDWFMCFWNNNQGHMVPNSWKLANSSWILNKLQTCLPLTHCVQAIKFTSSISQIPVIENKTPETNIASVWNMWYSILLTDRMRIDYQTQQGWKYDLVIKARPDVGFDGTIDLNQIYHDIQDNQIFTTNQKLFQVPINDMIAIGRDEPMQIYCKTFLSLPSYIEHGIIFHPETMLLHHLTQNNLEPTFENWGNLIFRRWLKHNRDGSMSRDFGKWGQ